METKMITIPFDLERAKRIQEGKEEGKIITKSGRNVRIICWDLKNIIYPIIGIVYNKETNKEVCNIYRLNGYYGADSKSSHNLVLQIPEYTQYKDGDILVSNLGNPFIFKGINGKYCDYYVGTDVGNKLIFRETGEWCHITGLKGYANEEQKQQLIKALQNSINPLAKEYLKRFFNIEKEEFKPFDKVLVREGKKSIWIAAFFSVNIGDVTYPYVTTGDMSYSECVPYNEETKHLLGTDKDWE